MSLNPIFSESARKSIEILHSKILILNLSRSELVHRGMILNSSRSSRCGDDVVARIVNGFGDTNCVGFVAIEISKNISESSS